LDCGLSQHTPQLGVYIFGCRVPIARLAAAQAALE